MDWQQLLALTPILLAASISVILLLVIAFVRDHLLTCLITCLGLSGAALSSLISVGDVAQQVTPLLIIDDFSRLFGALILLISLISAWMTYPYLQATDEIREEYYILLALAALGALILIASNHFASMFIGLELVSVSLFAMVGYLAHSRDQVKLTLEAGVKYMVLSGVSSSFLLFGVALVYAYSGSLSMNIFSQPGSPLLAPQYLILGTTMIAIGIAFKMSWVPFHMWTPDVYQGAPAPVTGFLAGGVKIAVFALLIRWLMPIQGPYLPILHNGLMAMAALSMIFGNLLALRQDNLKRLLAYSSIAHMGYAAITLIAAINVGNLSPLLAAEAAGMYLVTYAAVTMLAFTVLSHLAAQDLNYETGQLSHYQGLLWQQPMAGMGLIIAMLALAGMPLTAGFIGKYYVFIAAVDQQLWPLLWLLIIGSAMGLYYYLRVILILVNNTPEAKPTRNWGLTPLIILLGLATLWLGIYPGPSIAWVQLALAGF
ncbi:MAG: NADH-quinone oxidoreductase subunit N [Gammaproteobacteria bacterium]|jgi:NADH-quinone oxidoreductase subunit N|nr:NADH-quinone oxidoreductase subunit N [Gammaproteobacteria bacterium]MDP6166063.1 NADH-quinone oxidoreductase subunit N [Gammaproteobacteria bacterium]